MWLLIIVASLMSTLGPTHGFVGELRPKNPEASMSVAEMISYWGYPSEEYKVVTQDGYILGINRIPHGKINSDSHGTRPVVFLQHGVLASSSNWVANLPNNSLAFILADAGFDVWLGNSRGNTYSRKNIYYPTDSEEFWAFSFDEMAKYDLPATIDFILEKTGREKLHYIGHSQGTTIGFIAFSTNPELAKKIEVFYALAPIAFVNHATTPFRRLSFLPISLVKFVLGNKMFFEHNILDQFLATEVCSRKVVDLLCKNALFLVCGFDTKNFNMSRFDVYLSHNPAGTSVQDILHWDQALKTGKFQAYDWGSSAQNIMHYNQPTPPQYNLTSMHVPIALWSGGKDWLADPQDVNNLLSKLPNIIYHKEIASFNHLDFIWAENVPQEVYNLIVSMLKKDKN